MSVSRLGQIKLTWKPNNLITNHCRWALPDLHGWFSRGRVETRTQKFPYKQLLCKRALKGQIVLQNRTLNQP